MGKSRRNRSRAHHAGPITKTLKPLSDPELISIRNKRILPVLGDLQSPEPKSRTAAAGAIANIVQDEKCRKLLLREQVVHVVLSETLTDSSIESRAAGWQILNVIAQEEENDFCVHLYRLDILTAIEHAGNGVADAIVASEPSLIKTSKAHQLVIWEIAGSLVALLAALTVASDEVLESIVARKSILRFLFTMSTAASVPKDLLNEALSCLMTIAEDNINFGQAAIDDQESRFYDRLLYLKDGADFAAVSACGILHNIFSSLQWQDYSPGKDGASDAVLVLPLVRVLETTVLHNAQPELNGCSSSPVAVLQMALEILAMIGTDCQPFMQITSKNGIGRTEDEWNGFNDTEAMDEDGTDNEQHDQNSSEEEDIDGEMNEDDIESDMRMVTEADDDMKAPSGLEDLPTLSLLLQRVVPQLIKWSQFSPESDATMDVPTHALSALNNISWSISCFDFTNRGNASVYRIWAKAANSIWRKAICPILAADTADIELATMITSLAWAIARSLAESAPLAGYEHRKFMTLYQASTRLHQTAPLTGGASQRIQDPLQGLGVKCVGVLGQLARGEASEDLSREVGVFMMNLLAELPQTPAADAVEALNQLFDMYGDEQSDTGKEVFWKSHFLDHLEKILPKIKTMAKSIDKREFGELRSRADEAVLNLRRFIAHKRKHAP